jgi:fermentation-respiration switch protein FrsA (DUF1100 family)
VLVHGEEDTVVPITLGERLYAMIQAPKHFVRVAGGEHSDLGARAVAAAKRFVAESRGRVSSGSAPWAAESWNYFDDTAVGGPRGYRYVLNVQNAMER